MSEVTREELAGQSAALLPNREALALLNVNVAVPVNTALALNVLTVNSDASAFAGQIVSVDQS